MHVDMQILSRGPLASTTEIAPFVDLCYGICSLVFLVRLLTIEPKYKYTKICCPCDYH